ncbi:PIN domain-containing protein [Geodermatophilus sp. SYSU D00779]
MIVVDTGPVVALVNERDDHHERCRDFPETHPAPLLLPATVFTEMCLLLERRRGTQAELAFLADVRAARFG